MIVLIEEIDHPELVRDGNNLLYNHYISYPEAVMGTTVEVPTLEGKARVKIEAGTQSGKILKLKNKGLPSLNSYGRGDLLVGINVWTPQVLSKEEKALIYKLMDSENIKPQPGLKDRGFFEKMREFFQ